MKRSLFDTPQPIDLLGLPTGNYWTHTFPADMPPGEKFTLTLNDVQKKLINFSGDNIEPDRLPKQRDKLARNIEIELRFAQQIKTMKIFLNMNSRIVFVLGRRDTAIVIGPEILKPAETHIITYYKRGNKRKVINACFLGPGHPVTDIHLAMAKCEVVMAVDTNTRDVPGVGKVSATTAIEASLKEVTEDAYHLQSGPIRQKVLINSPGNPEIFGIGTMMFHFFETNPHLRDKRIGIITDTELDLIRGINQRTTPFFQDMLLPENTDLFYATGDTGSAEFMANKLVRMCDKASAEYLAWYLRDRSLVPRA